MLSLNARGVNAGTVRAAKAALGEEHVFATGSLEEAAAAAATIRERGYETVVAGGGDGTLSATIQFLCAASPDGSVSGAASLAKLPAIAALPLGTGNAVARYVCGSRYRFWGGSKGVTRACEFLKRQSRSDGPARTIPLPIMETDGGKLCFIAGQGFDAFILDDYKQLLSSVKGTPLAAPLGSVAGYFVATALKTLPGYLSGRRKMRIRVQSPKAAWVDSRRGDGALRVTGQRSDHRGGDVLYEGKATIVAGGSQPFYGGGLRLFPFARASPDKVLHLRVATMSPWKFVPNVIGIFNGHYRQQNEALDFLGKEFTVSLLDDSNYPFQQSGDAEGLRRSWKLKIAGDIKFVDFLGMPEPIRNLKTE